MDDICSGIKSIGRFAEFCITLGGSGFRIYLHQVDPGIHSLILESMGEFHLCLLVISVGETERIDIILVPVIVFRSLQFLHIIATTQRNIRRKHSTSVCTRCHLLNKGILLHHHCAVCSLDV